jgi:hypothetical protein
LRIVTVTAATVFPATALERPRAIVSTSGSSGTSGYNTDGSIQDSRSTSA